jgi:hypothetical protein
LTSTHPLTAVSVELQDLISYSTCSKNIISDSQLNRSEQFYWEKKKVSVETSFLFSETYETRAQECSFHVFSTNSVKVI